MEYINISGHFHTEVKTKRIKSTSIMIKSFLLPKKTLRVKKSGIVMTKSFLYETIEPNGYMKISSLAAMDI